MDNGFIYRDRYRILRKLGEGGSSRVYMAQDMKNGEPVTVKCIKRGKCEDEAAEENILQNLDNPAIPKPVAIYDDCIVLEYVPGNSLEKYMRHKRKLAEREVIRIAVEILDILQYLHGLEHPVIYRDLKPANIMIRPDGHVSLIDFGAARYYEEGEVSDTTNLGTNGFAAPEQYGSLGQTDPRTDIYCLGRTILQMVGGKCSPELMRIVEKCTKPDRDERFDSCSEITKQLQKCPGRIVINRVFSYLKLAIVALIVSAIVTLTASNYDAVKSYAYYDAEQRVPAVKERLGNAGIWIREFMAEKFEVEF